jgi:16S rRNA processing protein RimM
MCAVDSNDLITIGEITKPHGLSGEVITRLYISLEKFELESDEISLSSPDHGTRTALIERIRPHKGNYIMQLDISGSVEEAELLRGMEVVVERSCLKPREEDIYFVSDIVGLEVIDEGSRSLGSVVDVWFLPSNDVYVVQGDLGEMLIPAVEDYVIEINIPEGKMTVRMDDAFITPSKRKAKSA